MHASIMLSERRARIIVRSRLGAADVAHDKAGAHQLRPVRARVHRDDYHGLVIEEAQRASLARRRPRPHLRRGLPVRLPETCVCVCGIVSDCVA